MRNKILWHCSQTTYNKLIVLRASRRAYQKYTLDYNQPGGLSAGLAF